MDGGNADISASIYPFAHAIEALDNPLALTKEDCIDDNGEQRYQTIAAFEGRLLMIAHVYRIIDGEEIPWIICIRKAVNYEKEEYNSRRRGA